MNEKEYKTLYESLFDNNRDAIIFFNKTQITNANQAALELFEVTPTQFIGHQIYEFTKDENASKKRAVKRLEGESEFYTSRITIKSGVKEIEVSSTPVKIQGITSYSIVRDVTERNKAEAQYRNVVNQSPDLIVVTNDNGIVFINPEGLRYIGYEKLEQVLYKPIINFVHPDHQKRATAYSQQRRTGGSPPNRYHSKLVLRNGEEREVEFNSTYINWDGVPSVLTIVRDISEQIEYPRKIEALHRYASRLEQINTEQELADSFVEAADTILGYDRVSYNKVNFDQTQVIASKPDFVITETSINGAGITTRAARTQQPQIVQDVTKDPDYINAMDDKFDPTLSEYAAPIIVRGVTRAILNIERNRKNAFTENDTKLITTLTDHISSTLNRLQYRKRLETLYEYGAEISKSKTIQETITKTWSVVEATFETPVGSVGIVEPDCIYHIIDTGSLWENWRQPLDGKGICVRAVRTGKSQLVSDIRKDPDFITNPYGNVTSVLSELTVPIKVSGKVYAIINIEDQKIGTYNKEDQYLIETLAHIAGVNIERILSEDAERRTNIRLNALHTHSLRLDNAQTVKQVAEISLEILKEVFGPSYFGFQILQDNKLKMIHTIPEQEHFEIPLTQPSITVKCAKEGKCILVNDLRDEPDYYPGPFPALSELSVPVKRTDQVVAVINIESPNLDYFNKEDIRLVETLAMHISSALRRLSRTEELEKLVQERTEELIKLNQQLQELDKLKNNFIRTATHELRTPLTSIMGYLELVDDETIRDAPDEAKQYLDIVKRNTERLQGLTDDLLDQQRLESGQLELNKQPTEIRALITNVVQEMSPLFASKKQRLELELPDTMSEAVIDPQRIAQALFNLLSNAWKFSQENTTITIKAEEDKDNFKITVKDQGIGIRKDDLLKLFTPFPQIDRPIVSEKSTGLGLSITKSLILLHGGEIWVESDGINKGSVFTFKVPLK